MVESVHVVALETASGQEAKHRHEAAKLWLERKLLARSPYGSSDLVAAGPANLTGKANFGFDSRYQRGATVPSGNTQFNFTVANVNFHSTSYDWLVVAGAKAQYKGSGQ